MSKAKVSTETTPVDPGKPGKKIGNILLGTLKIRNDVRIPDPSGGRDRFFT